MSGAEAAVSGVAVVTGGGSGFGRAIADSCAAHGFKVAVLDIDGERAAAEAAAIGDARGVEAIGLRTDVGDAPSVESAAEMIGRQFGGADLVFSNVGVQQIGALEHFSDEAWRWMLDVNVIGAARVVRSFLPLLRRSDRAHLAFTASASVLAPASRLAAYQASKFAVVGLAETLRVELADEGIGVSVIYPSGMMTRHLESSFAARPGTITESIADEADTAALVASSPSLAEAVTAEQAARQVVDDVLAGERYIVTHGDLAKAVTKTEELLLRAVARGRDRQ